jgi:nitrate/TMAO reductase-like tetraheme cytochrome c subunit
LLLDAQIGFAALLLVLLILRPEIFRTLEGKLLGLTALFLVPAVALYGGFTHHVERAATTGYCLSCHVMSEYGKSLRTEDAASLPASHFQNHLVPADRACVSCHANYGLSGDLHAKVRATRYVFETYFGTVPETIRMASRYRNRECLRCHLGARSFERSQAHQAPRASMAAIKAGRTSCMKSGCHELVHNVRDMAAAPSAPSGPATGAPGDSAAAAPGAGPALPGVSRAGS